MGFFGEETKVGPTLADIRRWSPATWTNVFGGNMFEMDGGTCLNFRIDTWLRRSFKEMVLEKDQNGVNSITVERKWIKAVGVPLHLWWLLKKNQSSKPI